MKHFILLFFLMACAVLSGCRSMNAITLSSSDPVIVAAYASGQTATMRHPLNAWLLLTSVHYARDVNGFLYTDLTLKALAKDEISEFFCVPPKKIAGYFEWLDANGITVDLGYRQVEVKEISPGEVISFRSVAPRRSCTHFRFVIKETE